MIPRSSPTCQAKIIPVLEPLNWQEQLQDLITDPKELLTLLKLEAEQLPNMLKACEDFALRVPRAYAGRIKPNDPNDPLLLQILPSAQELSLQPGYNSDPLAEADHNPAPGLIHKYKSRALLIASNSCAINCRYCFRRHFPYQDNTPSKAQLAKALEYIASKPEINEVILSGGDPLSQSNSSLGWLINVISEIPQIKRLRIHTRLPVALPDRIDEPLCQILSQSRLKTIVVLHANHAQELDSQVEAACQRLRDSHCTLLNQAVLLAKVNNNIDAQVNLSERLFDCGVLPYYLHLLDRVKGAEHFDSSEQDAKLLYQTMLAELPGFLVPKLVREIPHKPNKTPIY